MHTLARAALALWMLVLLPYLAMAQPYDCPVDFPIAVSPTTVSLVGPSSAYTRFINVGNQLMPPSVVAYQFDSYNCALTSPYSTPVGGNQDFFTVTPQNTVLAPSQSTQLVVESVPQIPAGQWEWTCVQSYIAATPAGQDDGNCTFSFTVTADILAEIDTTGDTYTDTGGLLGVDVLEGESVLLQFNLTSAPQQPLLVEFRFDAPSAGTAATSGMSSSLPSLIFTKDDFMALQVVNFTAISNAMLEGNRTQEMFVLTNSSFVTWQFTRIRFHITDDDSPRWLISSTTIGIAEQGPGVAITVGLATQPSADVVVTFYQFPRQFTVSPAQLTFTAADFAPKPVTYLATLDNVVEGTMVFIRTFMTVVTTDPNYGPLASPDVTVTITDANINITKALPVVGFAQGGTKVTITFASTVTLNTDGVADPGLPIVDGSTLTDASPLWQQALGNEVSPGAGAIFVRAFICHWGTFTGAGTTIGKVINRRQLTCPTPACTESPTNATIRCISPVPMVMFVSRQSADPAVAPTFDYVWGPVDPEMASADDVYATQITGITPQIGSMNEETLVTVSGFNLGVMPIRMRNPPDVAAVTPWCRIDGFLVRDAYWVNPANHSNGIVCVAPTRPELTGSTRLTRVQVEITFNRVDYFQNELLTYSYRDMQRLRNNDAWTVFYVLVNVLLVIYIFLLLKSWICATFCRRCQKQENDEEDDYDVRGPKPVSNYLKAKIEDMLVKDAELREAARREGEVDMDLQRKLQAAGYADVAEDSKTRRRREEQERQAAETAKQADEVAEQREMAAQARVGRKSVLKREFSMSRKSVSKSNNKAGKGAAKDAGEVEMAPMSRQQRQQQTQQHQHQQKAKGRTNFQPIVEDEEDEGSPATQTFSLPPPKPVVQDDDSD